MDDAGYADEYLIGIELYRRGDYFEAHEAWEKLWRETPGPERTFLQGLIQVVVALCHFYNGNMRGASRLYHSSRAYLAPYGPMRDGLDVDRFLAELEACFAPVLEADPARPAAFDPDAVPAFELSPSPVHWPAIPEWVYSADERSEGD